MKLLSPTALCISVLLWATSLQASVDQPPRFDVGIGHGLPAASTAALPMLGGAQVPQLQPLSNLDYLTPATFEGDQRHFQHDDSRYRKAIAMGPADNSALGLGLAGLIFILYAARKFYRLSR